MTNQHQQTPHAPRHNPQKSSQTDARDPASATLAYHLECPSQKPKTACFLILNGNTVVFIPVNPNYVLLVDSHLHGQTGTFVALCERSSINELLEWYECFNNFHCSLGTVTVVTFG